LHLVLFNGSHIGPVANSTEASMAKSAAAGKGKEKEKGSSPLIPVALITLLVGGAGAFFGMQVPSLLNQSAAPKPKQEEKAKPDPDAAKITMRSLAPITTNLASPPNTWIRMETSAVIVEDLGPEGQVLMARLVEDIVAFLRTVPLDQIEGASGFQHLREDLNDRVRIRSQGKVRELLIEALVVQ
jgi:flagellar protein FliL